MKPSVGRIVHYTPTADGECQAAIICRVGLPYGADGSHFPGKVLPVDLTVFPDVMSFGPVGFDEGKSGHTWHWPERVED